MSLSIFLLGGSAKAKEKGKAIDKGLDDLFRTNVRISICDERNERSDITRRQLQPLLFLKLSP